MKNLLRVLLIAVLTLTMVLPLSFSASAADEEYTPGYAISEDGYVSNWVGSSLVTGVSYGGWVRTDGEWNGCFQWASNKDKVKYDSANGIITFTEGLNYNCKIYPAQTQSPIGKGGVFFSLDVLYQAPKADDVETNSNFCGMVLSDKSSNGDRNMLCITNFGEVYASRYNTQGDPLFVLDEGWNTIVFYIIPYVNDNGGIGNKVYLNIGNDTNIVPDTKGITKDTLDMYFYSYDYSNGKYFSELGANFYLSAYTDDKNSKTDNLSIRNAVIKNLEGGDSTNNYIPSAEENLYKVVYSGYADVTMPAYVPAAGGTIQIAKAYDMVDGEKDYVPYWKMGEDPDMMFYKPGDTVKVTSNMILKRASGSDLDFADLIAAYSKIIVTELDRYNYQELKAVRDEIQYYQDTIRDKGGNTDSSYFTKSETVKGQINTRMVQIQNRAWELIDAAAIFADYNAKIDDRVTAFEEIMYGEYDATFSAECAEAINQMQSFNATYEAIYEDLAQFRRNMQQLNNADDSTDRGTLIMNMMNNLAGIRRAGISNLDYDKALIETEYSNFLDMELSEFENLDTMAKMYTFLLDLMADYNEYKKIMYGERKRVDVPEQLQEMVDIYNEYVATINNQMIEANTVSSALQYNTVKLALMRDMMANIIEQKDGLFATDEEEEE